jgi:threonine/homoserine/homoserine lactone efflux protein
LLIAGVGRFLQIENVKIVIGILGGAFLIILGVQMLRDAKRSVSLAAPSISQSAFITGILLTAGNPYFLLWWATVGLALATQASQLGVLALVLFGVVHWLCDLVWLEILSQASYRGAKVFSEKAQRLVLGICGVALLFFAAKFVFAALAKLSSRL